MAEKQAITVYKRDHEGTIKLEYPGHVVSRGETWVCLDAYFRIEFVDIGVLTFRRGDKMREWFYSDRHYNVFQVHDGDTDTIKGWYCNITRPAEITHDLVSADDLALDVVVSMAGEIAILDEDEFTELDIPPEERQIALNAVDQLRELVHNRAEMFSVIP